MTTASTWKWVRKKKEEKKDKSKRYSGRCQETRDVILWDEQNKDGFYLGILGNFFAFYILIFHLSLYF